MKQSTANGTYTVYGGPTYAELLAYVHVDRIPSPFIAIDPGGISGVAIFRGGYPTQIAQIKMGKFDDLARKFDAILNKYEPERLVIEEYRIYGQKAAEHVGSDVPTLRLIGALEALAALHMIPVTKQSALAGKAFISDVKLRGWGFYVPNRPHANDAIRHGCKYVLFDKELSRVHNSGNTGR